MQTNIPGRAGGTTNFDGDRSVAGILRRKASVDIMGGARPALLAACAAAALLVAVIAFGSHNPVPGAARLAAVASAQTR